MQRNNKQPAKFASEDWGASVAEFIDVVIKRNKPPVNPDVTIISGKYVCTLHPVLPWDFEDMRTRCQLNAATAGVER
jgi:hypothetical protein